MAELPKHMRLFMESDTRLKSAISFEQYAFPIHSQFRLLTIIGEQHELEFDCKDSNQISIMKYALETLKNPLAEVLLEIDPAFIDKPEHWPKSIPIRGILEVAQKDPKLLSRIKGYDWRNYWLGAHERELLYHSMDKMVSLSMKKILDIYVAPLSIKWKGSFHLVPNFYNKDAYHFLTYVFLKKLDQTMTHIHDKVITRWDIKRARGEKLAARRAIVISLRHFWKEITDWNMLTELFRISKTDTIISIMGEDHRRNLTEVFKGLQLLTAQKGEEGKCVSLMKTVYIKK